MFKCKVCIAKDSHIQDLRNQISDLRGLVLPKQAPVPPDNVIEADAMLSGHQDIIESDPEAVSLAEEIQSERERILSGTY